MLKNANRCCYAMNTILSSKIFSWKTKLKCYKTILLPLILYSADTQILTKKDEKKKKKKIMHLKIKS